jgi:hypothetical protein
MYWETFVKNHQKITAKKSKEKINIVGKSKTDYSSVSF